MKKGEWILEKAHSDVIEAFSGEGSGHDHHHILRVRDQALRIQEEEGKGEPFFVELGALLHDVPDPKLNDGDPEKGWERLKHWMEELNLDSPEQDRLKRIIEAVSFKGAQVDDAVSTSEAAIVQDADRLDAMGAIGIARAFAFGGSRGRPIHIPGNEGVEHQDPSEYRRSSSPTIAHFHEKLLHLKDRMKTKSGCRIALERHRFMEAFLDRFHAEWEGKL